MSGLSSPLSLCCHSMLPSCCMTRLLVIAVLLLVSCDDRPPTSWTTQPQWTYKGWDVHYPMDLNIHELVWVRDSIASHMDLSEGLLWHPGAGNHPARWSTPPGVTPRIWVYDRAVTHLNSPIRIGVPAYCDHKRQEIHATMGPKLSMPGLARAIHHLRADKPDPWEQDPMLGWAALIQNETQLVDHLYKTR